MRWNALTLTLVFGLVGGCNKPAAKVQPDVQAPESAAEPELFAVDPAGGAVMPEAGSSTSTYSPPPVNGGGSRLVVATSEGVVTDSVAMSSGAGTTHRVVRGDTLYSLARRYYSDPKRWETIYQANRDKIPSPKSLPVGKTLVIP